VDFDGSVTIERVGGSDADETSFEFLRESGDFVPHAKVSLDINVRDDVKRLVVEDELS
jgi:hypothetical protein